MGTSTQTYKSYYCENCQLLAQYDNKEVTIDKCALSNEYITNELYGENSNVSSIYPNEIIELSDKLIKDYIKGVEANSKL